MREAAAQADGFEWREVADGELTFMWSPPKVRLDCSSLCSLPFRLMSLALTSLDPARRSSATSLRRSSRSSSSTAACSSRPSSRSSTSSTATSCPPCASRASGTRTRRCCSSRTPRRARTSRSSASPSSSSAPPCVSPKLTRRPLLQGHPHRASRLDRPHPPPQRRRRTLPVPGDRHVALAHRRRAGERGQGRRAPDGVQGGARRARARRRVRVPREGEEGERGSGEGGEAGRRGGGGCRRR